MGPGDTSSKDVPFCIKQRAVPLSSRTYTNYVVDSLRGTIGAEKIISQLKTQRSTVTQLILNHNPLGDDGISLLFNYLCSTAGSRHRIALCEINLNCTEMGCKGLQAVSNYIRGNEMLRELWLANNVLLPDTVAFSSLASAISDSRLRTLSFANNNKLGDAFVEHFFPLLRSRYLHELHISAVALTPRSAPIIGAWLSADPHENSAGVCYLQTFKSSGNSLGVNGVWEIVRAIERGNWGITRVEVYANQLSLPNPPDNETENAMKDAERALQKVLMRNSYWKRQTNKEALTLLRYSRWLLMPSKCSSMNDGSRLPSSHSSTIASLCALPMELKLCILGLLAPSLSPAQRMRIYNYASDPSTLPRLLPSLRRDSGKGSIVGHSGFLGSSIGFQVSSHCPDGKSIGTKSMLCAREEERNKFLEAMGCCAYEPEREGQESS